MNRETIKKIFEKNYQKALKLKYVCKPLDYYIAFEDAINYIKMWDNLKEKINQLQTCKLFNDDEETYLNKQNIINLVSEIEREVNNEQT